MSLVAYADSDDGSSDNEGESSSPHKSSISSDKSQSSTIILQEAVSVSVTSEGEPLKNTGKRSSLSSLLPKPNNPDNVKTITETNLLTLNIQNFNDEDEILEVEEEYVPLSQIKKEKIPVIEKKEEQKSVGSLFSRMPSPWSLVTGITLGKKSESEGEVLDTNKKSKQPVIIVAPTLNQADLEDDDDINDKGPAAKRQKKSNTGSGLSSLLPKPKHSVSVTAHNPNKPSAKLPNRTLIPHTLTKKPVPAKKDTEALKKPELGEGSGDEDDREPVSFFSFGDKESNKPKDSDKFEFKTSSLNISGQTEQTDSQPSYNSNTISSVPEIPRAEYSTSISFGTPALGGSSTKMSYEEVAGSSYVNYGNTSGTLEHYHYNEGAVKADYPQATDTTQHYTYETYTESPREAYYGNNTQEIYNQNYGEQVQEQTQNQTDDIDLEKLKKLQGKRNRNEQINIIDINAADQTGDTQLQMTKLTSEQIAHLPSKKKGSMPSSQQRRKHQITYLAFQAKEREFELQQQWATNRQTKRQTQAKYGF